MQEVQPDATSFMLFGKKQVDELRWVTMPHPGKFKVHLLSLPSANWQLIGITPLTEEQAGMVMESIDFQMDTYFKDYLSKESGPFGMYTATESFTSLLTANNIGTTKRWVVLFSQD